jgi:hypothetical protein
MSDPLPSTARMSHLTPNTTSLNLNRRASRAIKGIQELLESDDELYALDYTNLSTFLALASQENFSIEVSFDWDGLNSTHSAPQDSKALSRLLIKVRYAKRQSPRHIDHLI